MRWDTREYLQQRRSFLAERRRRHPMLTATTLIFGVTWLFGWLASTLLLHAGMGSMALRYGLSFVASYAVFFGCVRLWCNSARRDRVDSSNSLDGSLDPGFVDEGCFVVLLLGLGAFLIALLFWATGGFAALLEVAFEVAFAGTVVRGLSRTEIVGRWASTLFANTWLHALVALLVLVGGAAALQRAAPGAERFSDAVYSLWAKR